jgi:Spy/CpxP family protein refolding chaperone
VKGWQVILATLVIFGAGMVAGGLLVKRTETAQVPPSQPPGPSSSSPAPWRHDRMDFMGRIEKQLDLTPEQQERVHDIMQQSQERTRPVWELMGPILREELENVRNEIRAELTPEQQRKYHNPLKARHKRFEDRHGGDRRSPHHGPRRPPPTPEDPDQDL